MAKSSKSPQKPEKASTIRSVSRTANAAGHVRKRDPILAGLTNHCFGCAPGNRHGLHLKFTENAETGNVECLFRIPRRFEGPPGHIHGGVIAIILDEAMGKVNRRKGVVALTRHMTIDYLQPVPLNVKLRAVGWAARQEGRKHFHAGEIRALDGTVLARSEGLFVAVDPAEMFRKHLKKRVKNRNRRSPFDSPPARSEQAMGHPGSDPGHGPKAGPSAAFSSIDENFGRDDIFISRMFR